MAYSAYFSISYSINELYIQYYWVVYLDYKDLGLPDKALALVSFEKGCDILDAELLIVRVYHVLVAVTQEDTQEAVLVHVVSLRR